MSEWPDFAIVKLTNKKFPCQCFSTLFLVISHKAVNVNVGVSQSVVLAHLWESQCRCLHPPHITKPESLGEDVGIFVTIFYGSALVILKLQVLQRHCCGVWQSWVLRFLASPYFWFRPGLTLGRVLERTASSPEWTSPTRQSVLVLSTESASNCPISVVTCRAKYWTVTDCPVRYVSSSQPDGGPHLHGVCIREIVRTHIEVLSI